MSREYDNGNDDDDDQIGMFEGCEGVNVSSLESLVGRFNLTTESFAQLVKDSKGGRGKENN